MAFPWLGSIALLLLWVCRTTSDEVTCQPEPIAHGRIVSPRNIYKDGDRIQFSCDSGYKELDRSEATCTRNGWNVRLECVESVCLPPHIENGDIRPKVAQYRYEETVEVQCNAGFQSSAPTSICTDKGWQPPAMCILKNCGYVRIQNGHYYNELPAYFPKRLGYATDYTCDSGFLPPEKESWQQITCTKSGWDPEPKCFKKCEHRETFRNGQFIYSYWTSPFIEGDTIMYSCDRGYRPANKNATVTCTKDGWSPPPRCGTLEDVTCQPEPISHGRIMSPRNIYKDGDRIQISCDSGYKQAERSEATCTRNGWSVRLECVEIVCLPPHVENGDIRPKVAQYKYEETVEMLCNAGFQSSSPTSMCTDQGWQPPLMCIPKNCGYIRIQNGQFYRNEPPASFPKRLGYATDYMCDSGFLPPEKGSWQQIICTKSGWDPEPKCFKKCEHRETFRNGQFMYSYWTSPFIEGDIIMYSCDRGYRPANKSAIVTCTKNGWSPPPRCDTLEEGSALITTALLR